MKDSIDFLKASNKSVSMSYKKKFVNSKEDENNFIQKSNKKCSLIRQNLLELTKNEIKQSNGFTIKSYKEDLELEKLATNDSINTFKVNNENNIYDTPELNSEEELDLAYSKNKYAGKDCSSSNLSD